MTTGAVVFDDVTIEMGGRSVLSHVSFALPAGSFVGILGPNGAGKTTIMRTLLGLVRPSSGTISVLGRPAGLGAARIGYMPQHRSSAPGLALTVRSFMTAAAAGRRWGWPMVLKREADMVETALDSLGAGKLADRRIADLSGGERQRVFIAQALMGSPDILVLDEPLASLDPAHQRATVELVGRVAGTRGLTVLFSAHEINPILPAVDRILYLGNGQAASGTVDDVIQPAVLSSLYGTPVHVSRLNGRIFVMAESCELATHPHAGHDHRHAHDGVH